MGSHVTALLPSRRPDPGFRHDALLYAGEAEFVAAAADFVRDGVDAKEPTLVVVDAAKIERLREELGPRADGVQFADMAEVGANPARIIPAWHEFIAAHPGKPLRGIGEPINPERDPAALTEAQGHELLLNLAFADTPDFWLLCPYDTTQLPAAVIAEAHRSHPHVHKGGHRETSATYRGVPDVFDGPLPAPAGEVAECTVGPGALRAARQFVAEHARRAGFDALRTDDIVVAVNEVVTNSLLYGGGHGRLCVWQDEDSFICEVSDHGRLIHPLAGREQPGLATPGGRGLWMVNQLCDLTQFRSSDAGTTVRLHLRR